MARFFDRLHAKGKSKTPPKPAGPKPAGVGRSNRGARKARTLGARTLRLVRRATLAFFLSTALVTLVFVWVPPPFTPLMLIRCAGQLADGRPLRLHKDWVPLEDISPHLVAAVVAAEDQQFFDHRGFDFESIRSAFTVNLKGRRKLGASTITQQTAKNLYLWPDRSWVRKGLEAYFTFLMETFWSKRRILTVYLNVIETGEGIYGVEAAAREYYGVSAKRVSRGQAALLAAILPNPRRWSPERPTAYLLRRQAWILRQMALRGPLSRGYSSNSPRPFFSNHSHRAYSPSTAALAAS